MNRFQASFLGLALVFSAAASASAQSSPATQCYELSNNGTAWSRTPERLCVERQGETSRYVVRLQTGMAPADIVVFHFDLLARVRCADCNRDEFGLSNPSNSVLNALRIVFNGTRDATTHVERGTLTIGQTTFHYRSVAAPTRPSAIPLTS
ncbi:MAG: hypothetical protein IPK60_02370 [Sandaracinaceae bacterium]|nr:hypothetical protein [Sandaracinaceae bacterium]